MAGRRGVFDGVVENMHLHWKHRELVKLILKERDPAELQRAAKILEYASGGVLVAVVAISKGHAIIMYRGKNYERPSSLRPDNLLTKKEALRRSVEMQRCAVWSHKTLSLYVL
jgi:RNA-binding protein YhbY